MWYTNLQNLKTFGLLHNLTEAFFCHNQIHDISAIKNCKQITILNICNNFISNIDIIENYKDLLWLEISGNLIVDITVLTTQHNISSFKCSNN